jgi:hypothetical protein
MEKIYLRGTVVGRCVPTATIGVGAATLLPREIRDSLLALFTIAQR